MKVEHTQGSFLWITDNSVQSAWHRTGPRGCSPGESKGETVSVAKEILCSLLQFFWVLTSVALSIEAGIAVSFLVRELQSPDSSHSSGHQWGGPAHPQHCAFIIPPAENLGLFGDWG